MLIGLIVPLIGDIPPDIVYSSDGILEKLEQSVVVRSSAEVVYRSMVLANCKLFQELKIVENGQMKLYCYNHVLHIASNLVFMRELNIRRLIVILLMSLSSNDKLINILTKSLRGSMFQYWGHDLYV